MLRHQDYFINRLLIVLLSSAYLVNHVLEGGVEGKWVKLELCDFIMELRWHRFGVPNAVLGVGIGSFIILVLLIFCRWVDEVSRGWVAIYIGFGIWTGV